jgi:aminopeptidase N
VYHDVSHLWTAPDLDRPSPRWNEGLGSFLQQLATEAINGRPTRADRADRLIGWLRDHLARRPEWRDVPLSDYGRAQMTDLSYSVGALFFDLLYRTVGLDHFNRIVGGYYQERALSGGTTRDFVAHARRVAGARVDPLAQDWIFTTGWAQRIERAPSIEALAASYANR